MNLVAPNNKRRIEVIVVGTGLAGASAAATLGELGYKVKAFTFHDSPRRIGYFMIQLKVAIIEVANRMCIDWLKQVLRL